MVALAVGMHSEQLALWARERTTHAHAYAHAHAHAGMPSEPLALRARERAGISWRSTIGAQGGAPNAEEERREEWRAHGRRDGRVCAPAMLQQGAHQHGASETTYLNATHRQHQYCLPALAAGRVPPSRCRLEVLVKA